MVDLSGLIASLENIRLTRVLFPFNAGYNVIAGISPERAFERFDTEFRLCFESLYDYRYFPVLTNSFSVLWSDLLVLCFVG